MSQPAPSTNACHLPAPLQERIAEALASRTTPLSQLLRLIFALDEQAASGANENLQAHLRATLRARIGEPLAR